MKSIRSRVQNRENVYGVWCSLASPIGGEIVAGAGYDWMLLDVGHAHDGHGGKGRRSL